MAKETAAAVQVALRIRPLTERDRAQPRFANLSNDDVLKIHEKTVHVVPHNKLFTFDHVFGTNSRQSEVFEALGAKLINKFTEGYNVTILAYGQTSSGKTYTMGTAQHQPGRYNMEQEGIVPRAMALLFDTLAGGSGSSGASTLASDRPVTPAPSLSSSTDNTTGTRLRPPSRASHHARSSQQQSPNSNTNGGSGRKYSVKVSFVEIYNEELIDLLNSAPINERPPVNIREDAKGHIYWTGVKEVSVNNTDDVLFYLEQGTRNRATGATDMNEKSSRSHAIFSVSLRQEKWASRGGKGSRDGEWMVTTSKFHFVDLAGSERLKRTAAEGERRKEGININAGLLALGNVISALGDSSKRSTHIPYRDSKLTRLLQDSLGGSATTLMIACASPVEYNLSETLNTLQYANRARNIKNRVEKNEVEEWMTSDNIELLRSIIARLKSEVRSMKAGSISSAGSAATMVDQTGHSALMIAGAGIGSSDLDQVFQEQRLVIADLKRQVEELDGEASVTRERNRVVEAELKRLRKLDAVRKKDSELREQNKSNYDFQHLVEPVIEEYEKSIAALESQLAMARAALNHSDIGFEEQRQKLEECELMLENQDQTVIDLRSRLNKLQERESNNEAYIDELEGKLLQSTKDARRDQELLNELKTRIMRFKETDENTEQYIFDLEQRLATSEAERQTIQETVEKLEKRLAERDATIDQLRKQLAKAEDTDTQKMMLQEIDSLELRYTTLEKERDHLKTEIDRLSAAQKDQQQRHQEQQQQLQRLSVPPSPLPKSIQEEQQELDAAAKTRYADEQETLESKGALAVRQAEERLVAETDKVAKLTQTLLELRNAHHELQEVHDELLKENDEVLMRYQEVTDQLALLNRPDNSMDALSKEMSRAKEEADLKEREERLLQIKELESKLAETEAKEVHLTKELTEAVARQDELQQELAGMRTTLTTAEAALEANQVELEETRMRMADLHRQLADLQARHADELEQSKAECGSLQTRLDETLGELNQCKDLLATQTSHWENQLMDTRAELERHVSSKMEQGEQLSALQKQLAEAQADAERHRGILETSSAESDGHMTVLQQKLADVQADLDNHRQLLNTKVAEGITLLEKLRSTEAELEAHRHAKKDLETLQDQMVNVQVELMRHKDMADAGKQQLAELGQQRDELQDKVRVDAEQVASIEKILAQALAELDNHKQLLESGNMRLKDAQSQLEQHKHLLDVAIAENTQLKESLVLLEKSPSSGHNDQELAETKAELARHRQLLNDNELKEKQHMVTAAALEQRLVDTQAELERSAADHARTTVLKQRLSDTEEELARFRSNKAAMHDQLSQLEQQLAAMHSELETYRGASAQVSALQERLTVAQTELERNMSGPEATILKQQLAETQDALDRYKDANNQLALLKQRLAATEADLESSAANGAQRAALEEQLNNTQIELEKYRASKGLANEQLSKLQERLSATQAELERTGADGSRAAILQQRLISVEEEMTRYKEASDQTSELRQRFAELQETTASRQQQDQRRLVDVQQELERYKAMTNDFQQRLEEAEATTNERDDANKETQAELQKTRAHVKELEALLQQQHQPKLETDNARDERLIGGKMTPVAEMMGLQEHQAALELKDKAISDLQQDLDVLEEALAQAEERQKKAEQEHLSLLDDVTMENDQLAGRVKELEQAHDANQQARRTLEDRVKELERTREQDRSVRQTLEERIKQLEAEVRVVTPPSPKGDSQQQQLQLQQQKLEEEHQEHIEALQEELELAQATNTEKDGHLRTLRSQVEAHARTIAELEDQLKKAEFTNKVGSSTKDEISKLYEERMGGLEQKTKMLEEENKEYQTLSEELEAEVSRLIKKEDQDAKAKEVAVAAAVAETEKQMAAAHEAARSQAEARMSALEAQLATLEEVQQDAGSQVADAQAKLAEAQAKLADVERRAQAELGEEKKAREQAERTLASLESQMEEMISRKSKFMCF